MTNDASGRSSSAISRLLDVMIRLRDPKDGCPWDRVQTFGSIAPYTIEEAYEVADAIANDDMASLREELGDLLLQVAYHSQIASEAGAFDFEDVAAAIVDKMIARHPHVFGDTEVRDAAGQHDAWERQKAHERERKATDAGRRPGILDDLPVALPALTRAVKLQKRAARVGFDWPDAAQVLDKIVEEVGEVRAEIETAEINPNRIADEVGDLLFATANLARHLGVDAEAALRGTNRKFERRFGKIEAWLQDEGRRPDEASLEEMEVLWQRAKGDE